MSWSDGQNKYFLPKINTDAAPSCLVTNEYSETDNPRKATAGQENDYYNYAWLICWFTVPLRLWTAFRLTASLAQESKNIAIFRYHQGCALYNLLPNKKNYAPPRSNLLQLLAWFQKTLTIQSRLFELDTDSLQHEHKHSTQKRDRLLYNDNTVPLLRFSWFPSQRVQSDAFETAQAWHLSNARL